MARVHVFYEVVRLCLWSRAGIARAAFADPAVADALGPLIAQATLESALLHLRNVIAFLLNPRPTNPKFATDLVADDYFDGTRDTRPSCLLGENPDQHRDLMNDLHRRLAHLSTQRLQDQTPEGGFNWGQVLSNATSVLDAYEQFVEDLRVVHPERALWFDESLAEMRRLAPR